MQKLKPNNIVEYKAGGKHQDAFNHIASMERERDRASREKERVLQYTD